MAPTKPAAGSHGAPQIEHSRGRAAPLALGRQQPERAAARDHAGQRLVDEQFDQAGRPRDHAGVLFGEGKGPAGGQALRRLGDERVV